MLYYPIVYYTSRLVRPSWPCPRRGTQGWTGSRTLFVTINIIITMSNNIITNDISISIIVIIIISVCVICVSIISISSSSSIV